MIERESIQESLYPELTCFGCGHANPEGFHLRSYRDGDGTVAEFTHPDDAEVEVPLFRELVAGVRNS